MQHGRRGVRDGDIDNYKGLRSIYIGHTVLQNAA